MPDRSLSPRVRRLIAAARKTAQALQQIKKIIDDYMVDGVAPERAMAAVALSLTHHDINELNASLAAFDVARPEGAA